MAMRNALPVIEAENVQHVAAKVGIETSMQTML